MNTQTDQVPGHALSVSTLVAGHDGQQADVAAGMVAIAGVHGVLAPFAYPQEQITRGLGAMLSPDGTHVDLIEKIHAATGVRSRNLALELAAGGRRALNADDSLRAGEPGGDVSHAAGSFASRAPRVGRRGEG